MDTKENIITYCMTFKDVYADHPFRDNNWTVMRCKKNKKTFAYIYERDGFLCINVKCDPEWTQVWRESFQSVVPGFHMNKKYWNTILVDGNIPEKEIKRMIGESYDLVKPRKQKGETAD